jgi:hypothetical protein
VAKSLDGKRLKYTGKVQPKPGEQDPQAIAVSLPAQREVGRGGTDYY